MMKLQIILAVVSFCAISTTSASALKLGEEPLRVELFYECYCDGCIDFVENELLDVYHLFKENVQLDLLPYGNTEQKLVDGHWVFKCQHGPKECVGNKLHACAIYQACGDSGTVSCPVSKINQVLEYISCVMKEKDQLQATPQCAKTAQLDADNIISCANGDKGNQLLNFYGNRTEKDSFPWRGYVPAVAVNGKEDTAARDNLMDRLCQLKPDVCKHT